MRFPKARASQRLGSDDTVLLMLEVPRTNDKKELAAEQMLAALHGILRTKRELRTEGRMQEHFSMEISSIAQRIRFYIWCPKHLQAFVEGQIYAQYPTVLITEGAEDYSARILPQPVIHSSEMVLTDHETIPLKTFPSFEVDPLASITATLAKLDQTDEEVWIQILARPIADEWHKRGSKMVKKIQSGGGGLFNGSNGNFLGQAFGALTKPPEAGTKTAPEVSERDKSRIAAIQTKGTKLGYQVKIRIMYAGHDQQTARLRMQAIIGAFKQFNTTNLNGFQGKNASFDREKLLEYQARFFIDSGYILNIEELASLFHLPHTSVETPNIVWATTKTAEPPANVPVNGANGPEDLSLFGVTNFRGSNTVFGMHRGDRGRHLYVIGQTGTGKSGLLELLALSDVFYDVGYAIIDPHGDFAQNNMKFIPERRIKDVVYFNPADRDYPIGFNPLEVTDPSLKNHISSELVGVLKRMFDSWGPRLEYILRYTILALLDYPNASMLDITRMLTEKGFRDKVISYIDDPVVKTFWTTEFASWNEKFASEAVAPVLNKVGAFTANPMIRNIVGQTKSTFNIRQIMDEGKILIVNLSRGLVGEDNAAILGALMVTKIQLAAMSRANVALQERTPFYLYVDEFQNFATDSFAVILSEARKYGLNLTVANQYVSQMEETVRDAVFGNVGSMVSFRVGADDGAFLAKYYTPQFEPLDLMQLHNRTFVCSMAINGEKSAPFSGKTLQLPPSQYDFTEQIVDLSRRTYAVPRQQIEDMIRATSEANAAEAKQNYTITGAQGGKGRGGQGGYGGGGGGGGYGGNNSGNNGGNRPQSNQNQPPSNRGNSNANVPNSKQAIVQPIKSVAARPADATVSLRDQTDYEQVLTIRRDPVTAPAPTAPMPQPQPLQQNVAPQVVQTPTPAPQSSGAASLQPTAPSQDTHQQPKEQARPILKAAHIITQAVTAGDQPKVGEGKRKRKRSRGKKSSAEQPQTNYEQRRPENLSKQSQPAQSDFETTLR